MFQEFFKDTLISRFIKRLLRATNLPLLHTIHENSFLAEGCCYLYNDYVIKCTCPGKFYTSNSDLFTPSSDLFPSPFIYPAETVANSILATYEVIKKYDENDMQLHYNFHSKFMYYDSDTHYHLGEYLRYLKDRKGLNLMPYYNCFSNKEILGIHLKASTDSDSRTFSLKSDDRYKLLAVPVKFGQTYTIAIDSTTPIYLRSLIYNDDAGCIIKNIKTFEYDREYYSDDLDDYEYMPSSSFNKPFIKTILGEVSSDLFAQEKNLYLVIQVSKNNNSALTVLEGDYRDSWKINRDKPTNIIPEELHYKNLSLLQFNSHTSYAFSDRLIEYLLLNVIDKTEEIDNNIGYVQDLLLKIDPDIKFDYKNIWTDLIRDKISSLNDKLPFTRDLDGYLNKDIEKFLLDGGK